MRATLTTANWKWTGLRGTLALLAGAALLIWPGIGLGALVICFGVLLGIAGAFALTMAFQQACSTETRALLGLEGVAMLIAGGVCLAYPAFGLGAMIVMVALWLAIEGVLALRLAWKGDREFLLGGLGVLALVASVFLLVSPFVGALTVLALTAADFLLTGGVLLALAWRLRKLEKEGVESMSVAVDPTGTAASVAVQSEAPDVGEEASAEGEEADAEVPVSETPFPPPVARHVFLYQELHIHGS